MGIVPCKRRKTSHIIVGKKSESVALPYISRMDALGRHLLVELYACDRGLLNDVGKVEQLMKQAAEAAGATIIQVTFHHFSPHGVSGVVVIQESHLAIHTWPEAGYAAVDLFTCGDGTDPWQAYETLKKGLKAGQSATTEIHRGSLPSLSLHQIPPPSLSAPGAPPIRYQRDTWFTERNASLALSLRQQGERLYQHQSPYQKIELYDTTAYGKMLVLDGRIVFTEADEYIYHEMLTHVPMQILPQARHILVIGGGDGGILRELYRYPDLETVTALEIDAAVVKLGQEHFPKWWNWAGDPRFMLITAEAQQFVKTVQDQWYDLIIVDVPVAIGPEGGRFGEAFYQDLRERLTPEGILVAQTDSPRYRKTVFCESVGLLKKLFDRGGVWPFLVQIPTYPGGQWSFALCRQVPVLPEIHWDVTQQFTQGANLKYYNAKMHGAAFALPNDLQNWIEGME